MVTDSKQTQLILVGGFHYCSHVLSFLPSLGILLLIMLFDAWTTYWVLQTTELKNTTTERKKNHLVWQLVHSKAQDSAPKDMENLLHYNPSCLSLFLPQMNQKTIFLITHRASNLFQDNNALYLVDLLQKYQYSTQNSWRIYIQNLWLLSFVQLKILYTTPLSWDYHLTCLSWVANLL